MVIPYRTTKLKSANIFAMAIFLAIQYVIINIGQKNSWIKFLPTRAGGEINDNFLLAKISSYMV